VAIPRWYNVDVPIKSSHKAAQFGESVIREMTRLFLARGDKPGVNLAQGFPDFPAPREMTEAACTAIAGDINQYAITWGAKKLRNAIADNTARFYGVRPDPDREITVTCGATEAMIAALMAIVDPGDEVIVFEPFYENYGPDAILCGATPRFVQLHEPQSPPLPSEERASSGEGLGVRASGWHFDPTELAAAFNDKTGAIIINTPNNPTGKVFSRAELTQIAELCQKWDVVAITDEIYEHIVYEGAHVRMADIPGMADRTITISGLSKTYSATGWRIGWIIAPPEATNAVRKVHDFLTVGAAAPLQEGAALALGFPDEYFRGLSETYRLKRDFLVDVLRKTGFHVYDPHGAYYIMTDIAGLGWNHDVEFARWLIDEIGVAVVPGSSFYREPERGRTKVRFCYCKRPETLDLAAQLLSNLKPRG
jgi:aminotransferase